MLTRRHLFRTLSAIAVAPLAKWMPKNEVTSFDGGFPDECVTYTRLPGICVDTLTLVAGTGVSLTMYNGIIEIAVPQEEA